VRELRWTALSTFRSSDATPRKYFHAPPRSVLWRKIRLFLFRTDRAILSGCPNRAPFIAKTVATIRIWVSCPTLAQRVEVADKEVRIMGSKSRLLLTLLANGCANAVPTQF
jgi:hypothetical protein